MDAENCEGRISLSTTSPSSPETEPSASKGVVEEWLVRFAANSGQPLDDGRIALWCDEFSKVETGLLERSFQSAMHLHTFNCIPTVGEVWAQIEDQHRSRMQEGERVARERLLSRQPSWEELHCRGRTYCAQVAGWAREIAELQRSQSKAVAGPIPLVIVSRERLAELEEQKRIILARYRSHAALVSVSGVKE
jgi:hypothetical protein